MNVFDAIEPRPLSGRREENTTKLDVAKKLERAFISEMLSFVNVDKTPSEFGGGIGEAQFQSFLRDQHADLISNAGGLGLVEHFLKGLHGE